MYADSYVVMENEGEYSVHATYQAYSGDSYLSTDDGTMVYAVFLCWSN